MHTLQTVMFISNLYRIVSYFQLEAHINGHLLSGCNDVSTSCTNIEYINIFFWKVKKSEVFFHIWKQNNLKVVVWHQISNSSYISTFLISHFLYGILSLLIIWYPVMHVSSHPVIFYSHYIVSLLCSLVSHIFVSVSWQWLAHFHVICSCNGMNLNSLFLCLLEYKFISCLYNIVTSS